MAIESLGGYRIIRKLGEGMRADVLLAHPDDPDGAPVVIKAYRAGAGIEVAMTEAEALHRASGEHVVRLLDLAPDVDGLPALVLERLPGGSLARLLAARGTIGVGEAITILAPLALALERAHDAGVLHGAIRAEAVLFDACGAPVLAGFGRARLVSPAQPAAAREAEPGFEADARAFCALAHAVLERTAASAAAVPDPPPSLQVFADHLFALGEAAPVRFEPDPAPPTVPARLLRGDPLPPEELPRLPAVALGVPEWVERMLPADLRTRVAAARRSLASVRRPVWLAAGAVALALVAALALLPSETGADAVADPAATPEVAAAPADPGPVGGDDPVAAALALLATRERCIRELSVLCLDLVGQPGSAALADDQELVRGLQNGAEAPVPPEVDEALVTLVERMGDSAIVALGGQGQPASLLLMKGETGWRVRQYLPG